MSLNRTWYIVLYPFYPVIFVCFFFLFLPAELFSSMSMVRVLVRCLCFWKSKSLVFNNVPFCLGFVIVDVPEIFDAVNVNDFWICHFCDGSINIAANPLKLVSSAWNCKNQILYIRPFHTDDNKPHGNQLPAIIQHKLVYRRTNDCLNLWPHVQHLLHDETEILKKKKKKMMMETVKLWQRAGDLRTITFM